MRYSDKIKKISNIAIMISVGLVLWIFEEMLPHPIPFFRIGLGNIVVVIALFKLGKWECFLISTSRILLGAILLGRLFSPTFVFSISGAVISAILMIILFRSKINLSPIGISVGGAFVHILAQLSVASIMIYNVQSIVYLAPGLLILSIFSGFITGIIALLVINRTSRSKRT